MATMGWVPKRLTLALSLGVAASCAHSAKTPSRHPGSVASPLARAFVESWRRTYRTAALADARSLIARGGPVRTESERIAQYQYALATCDDDSNDPIYFSSGQFNAGLPIQIRDQLELVRVPKTGYPGYCPYWTDRSYNGPSMILSIESRLPGQFQSLISIKRAMLVKVLDSLSKVSPADVSLAGQTVRFALSANDTVTALAASNRCVAERAFCARLRGLVLLNLRREVAADSMFRLARDLDRGSGLCDDGSQVLVGSRTSVKAESEGCQTILAAQEWLWWLSSPLWSAPVNSRRNVHEARRTEIELRQQVGADELLDFSRPNVGSARALVLRFGWPSAFMVLDSGTEYSHMQHTPRDQDVPRRLLGAPLYSRDRYATVPNSAVIADPFRASTGEWPQGWSGSRDPNSAPWPWEHAQMRPLLLTTTESQMARFVRDARVRFVVAAPIPRGAGDGGSSFRSTLMWSSNPDTILSIGEQASTPEGLLRVVGDAPLGRSVMSLETRPLGRDLGAVAWRARFGQISTEGLRSAIQGDAGISDILLFDPQDPSNLTQTSLEKATLGMLTSSTLPTTGRVGLFWEVYAPSATDSIAYRVTVTGKKGAVLARVLSAVVGRNATDSVAVSWTQTSAGSNVQTMTDVRRGFFPTAIALNLAPPESGDYTIRIDASVYLGRRAQMVFATAPLRRP